MEQFFGNTSAKELLSRWVKSGRLPHCIILEGEEGVGKKTFARLVAAAFLCQGENPPCGQCKDCRKILAGLHPDVLNFGPEEGSRTFKVELVRQVIASASVAANEARGKVYILEKAHDMNTSSQNSLLKLIEEPPASVWFILTCENRMKLLPTILSRAVVVPLTGLPEEDCALALAQLVPEASPDDRITAARNARGNLGQALELLKAPEKLLVFRDAEMLLQAIQAVDEYQLLRLLKSRSTRREEFLALLEQLRRRLCDQLIVGVMDGGAGNIPRLQAMKIIDIIELTATRVAVNGNMTLAMTGFSAAVMDSLLG